MCSNITESNVNKVYVTELIHEKYAFIYAKKYTIFKNILSQIADLINGQIKYYLKIHEFDLSLNLPFITNYITIILYNELNNHHII